MSGVTSKVLGLFLVENTDLCELSYRKTLAKYGKALVAFVRVSDWPLMIGLS